MRPYRSYSDAIHCRFISLWADLNCFQERHCEDLLERPGNVLGTWQCARNVIAFHSALSGCQDTALHDYQKWSNTMPNGAKCVK